MNMQNCAYGEYALFFRNVFSRCSVIKAFLTLGTRWIKSGKADFFTAEFIDPRIHTCLLSIQVADIITCPRILVLGTSYGTTTQMNTMKKCLFSEILRLKVYLPII